MEQNSTATYFSAHPSEVSPDPSTNMSGPQTTATATSARDNLPAPRDLNHSFYQSATQQTTFSEINDAHQRIAQLERALASMVHEQTLKNNNIQALQATVVRLEADTARLQADMFHDIDDAGMDAEPDAHLHSDWRPATSPLFSSPTPVKPPHVPLHPDAPRPQQQFPSVIDPASELDMIKKQIQELNHRLLTIPPQHPGG